MVNNFNAKFKYFYFFVMLTACVQCSLFATRNPEDPEGLGQIPFIQADRPEIVIQNLINAVTSLSFQNYLQCLHPSTFEFIPSLQASANNPGIWEGWSLQEEQTYFTNVTAEASAFTGHRLVFSNSRYEVFSETKQQFIANYTLTIVHNRVNDGVPTTAIGEIIFDIEAESNGLWTIKKWADISSDTFFSWSELKAVFIRS